MGSSLVGWKLPFTRDDERPEPKSTSARVVAIRTRAGRGDVHVAQDDRDAVADPPAGVAEVAAPVLDRDHVVAVDAPERVALAVAPALLGDREVEADAPTGLSAREVRRVLLRDRQPERVRAARDQRREGQRL